LYDYDAAMYYVSRNVCSADAFYQGILGLSILSRDDKGNSIYVNNLKDFNDSNIYDEYFGVSTKDYSNPDMKYLKSDASNLKDKAGKPVQAGLMSGPGEFSSILETVPKTAFIKERKLAVLNYIKEANLIGQGMRFTVPETK